MKPRRYGYDYINQWRDGRTRGGFEGWRPYLWLQFDYRTDTHQPYHVCAEINAARAGAIEWPLSAASLGTALPLSNLDFRPTPPEQVTGAARRAWDAAAWGPHTLARHAGTPVEHAAALREPPRSYDEYHRAARPRGVSCVDIDIIERTASGALVGIEATHLWRPMTSEAEARRLFRYIVQKRLLRPGAHQLIVQHSAMQLLGGPLFLLVYNATERGALAASGNCLLLEIDRNVLSLLHRQAVQELVDAPRFMRFREAYEQGLG